MAKPSQPKILVAIPAYNEERYIGSVILKAQQYTDEVIVVDDGSTDDTSKIARLAGATVIRHEENKGYGAAIQSLLAEAKKKDPDILILLDADSQHNPDEIPSLIKPIISGDSDLVVGSREQQRGKIPPYRRIGQRVISYFSYILSRKKLSDSESGFRVFSRKAITSLELRETGMSISAETIADAAAKGLRVTVVPISAIYTRNGSTMNPIKHGLGVLNRIIVMISERKPLLFFSLCGGIFIVFGLVAGVIVIQTLYAELVLQAGTALISMLLITVGMLSIFTGIILHVIVKRID